MIQSSAVLAAPFPSQLCPKSSVQLYWSYLFNDLQILTAMICSVLSSHYGMIWFGRDLQAYLIPTLCHAGTPFTKPGDLTGHLPLQSKVLFSIPLCISLLPLSIIQTSYSWMSALFPNGINYLVSFSCNICVPLFRFISEVHCRSIIYATHGYQPEKCSVVWDLSNWEDFPAELSHIQCSYHMLS